MCLVNQYKTNSKTKKELRKKHFFLKNNLKGTHIKLKIERIEILRFFYSSTKSESQTKSYNDYLKVPNNRHGFDQKRFFI